MHEPLEFYPAKSVALTQYWIVAATGAGALWLLAALVRSPYAVDGWSWLWDVARIAGLLFCATIGGLAWRRAARIAAARANREPQLVIDPFGILIRDDFLWRAHRFAWSRITAVDPVPHSKGLSIMVRGRLWPLGRLVDVTTDSPEPAETVALRIERIARGRALH